jgi:hypothetical protein
MGFTQTDSIEVKQIKGKGRDVFARRLICDGQTIERVPVLVLPIAESRTASGPTPMSGYCFDRGRGTVAVALGYGSLYNHSYRPNARYEDERGQIKVFVAIRDICDRQALNEVVTESGLDQRRAESVLNSDEASEVIKEAGDRARRFRVDGVPFFIINDENILSGAQPPDVFLDAFNQALGSE